MCWLKIGFCAVVLLLGTQVFAAQAFDRLLIVSTNDGRAKYSPQIKAEQKLRDALNKHGVLFDDVQAQSMDDLSWAVLSLAERSNSQRHVLLVFIGPVYQLDASLGFHPNRANRHVEVDFPIPISEIVAPFVKKGMSVSVAIDGCIRELSTPKNLAQTASIWDLSLRDALFGALSDDFLIDGECSTWSYDLTNAITAQINTGTQFTAEVFHDLVTRLADISDVPITTFTVNKHRRQDAPTFADIVINARQNNAIMEHNAN